jgi:hypothetical protein
MGPGEGMVKLKVAVPGKSPVSKGQDIAIIRRIRESEFYVEVAEHFILKIKCFFVVKQQGSRAVTAIFDCVVGWDSLAKRKVPGL